MKKIALFIIALTMTYGFADEPKQTKKWSCPECGCTEEAPCGCSEEGGCKCPKGEKCHCGPQCHAD